MKKIILLAALFSISVWAQDPLQYLSNFDSKVYSLKSKGIKEFVVDIESTKLTNQMNELMIFGKVNELVFRTYWTAGPERIAIEIIGLPEGFKEIKEELKLSMMGLIDNLIPMTMAQRFAGYKFHSGATPKQFVAQDSTGIAVVPSYVLEFDDLDRLITIQGRKPIGNLIITAKYEKESFSDGKWVLKSYQTESDENGQFFKITKELNYGKSQGIGVLSEVNVLREQKSENGAKARVIEEQIRFKNYKINSSEAFKYFLGETAK